MNTPPNELPWSELSRWFAGEMTSAEAERFETWLRADQDRAAFVERLRQAWSVSGAMSEGWDAGRAMRHVRDDASRVSGKVIGIVRASPSPARRWPWVAASIAAAAVVVLVVGNRRPASRAPAAAPVAMTEYRAARGQRSILRLADGTQVTLAPGTVLRRPSNYGERERRLELEGQAFFIVTHDSTRPFTVVTERLVARDLGTRFDVRAYAADSSTSVVVAQGRVSLGARRGTDTASLELRPGDAGFLRRGSVVRRRVSLAQELAWLDGKLVFRDTPLAEVAARVARWYDVEVRVPDALRGQHVTASFGDEPAGDVLDAIASSLGATIVRHGNVFEFTRE